MPLLEISNLSIEFGGLKALANFNFAMEQNQLVALIGPNGAGKTTAFNIASGIYSPTAGSIRIAGEELGGRSAWQINRLGLARTFQNIRLFGSMTVLENVLVGFNQDVTHGFWGTLLRSTGHRSEEKQHVQQAMSLLASLSLDAIADAQANSLPYGLQRKLEIARALATGPRILCLDEPAAGMNPQEKTELMHLIRLIRAKFRVGIWLIEHDMKLVMSLAQRITVLDHGETIAVGSPSEIQANPRVVEAYLGEPE